MEILLIGGFLGSGKSTFAIELTKQLMQVDKRVAILVNEVGEVGIDGSLLKRRGLNVWEMATGCICCTLSDDLLPTLEKLDKEYDVDVIIIEPTGVADPHRIINIITFYEGFSSARITSIVLIDSLRWRDLYPALTHLLTIQVASADIILLNKKDIATQEQMDYAFNITKQLNSRAKVCKITAKEPVNQEILKGIMPFAK